MIRLRLVSLAVIVAVLLSLMSALPAGAGDVQLMAGNFIGQYYNDATLSGTPVLTRADASINFSWGDGSPSPLVSADNFSVRWTGSFPVANAGNYVFSLTTDDGARLWVDGVLVIDQWFDQPPTTHSATVALTAATHTFKVEYYEHLGQATIALAWGLGGSPETFSAEYFANMALSGTPSLTRIDPAVNFDWGYGSPGPALPVDYFSARWTAQVSLLVNGDYDFHLYIDDGARLYLDGLLILDRWYAQPATHHVVTHHATSGVHEIKMEYFEQTQIALARLWWEPHVAPAEVIVDDLAPGFTKGGPFHQAAIGYLGHMFWTRNATTVQENWARWTPTLPMAGQYEVYAYVPGNYATTRYAHYTVYHDGLWTTRTINQYIYYNVWVSLGIHTFNAGGGEFVFMNDVTGEPYLSRQIGFDAVKWVYRGP